MLDQINNFLRYLLILIFSTYSFAQTTQVKESFLWLRISKSRGNTFFRVFVDNTETPYVNLQEILTSYLDFSKFECDEQRQFCSAVLASQGNTRYWFDFKSKQCGSDARNEEQEEKKLDDADWQILENSSWVKYNVLEKCLPVEATWDLKLYYLSIIPSYPLVEDLMSTRERARLYNISMQKKREQISKIVPKEPILPYRLHGKYGVEYKKLPDEKSDYKMNYDLVGDIFKGTLRTGGDVLSNQNSTQSRYWTYTQRDKKYFKSLDIGDVFYDGGDGLLPNFSAINGLKLESSERLVGASIKTAVRGQNLPGTDVELYRNSFFLGSMIIPANGVYAFEDIFASGGDILLLKFYHTDGSITEKNIKVADDGARLIPYKESETRLFSGKTLFGNFSQASYRYGLHRKASLGLSGALLTKKIPLLMIISLIPSLC